MTEILGSSRFLQTVFAKLKRERGGRAFSILLSCVFACYGMNVCGVFLCIFFNGHCKLFFFFFLMDSVLLLQRASGCSRKLR